MRSPNPIVKEALRWQRYCTDNFDAALYLMTGDAISPNTTVADGCCRREELLPLPCQSH